jgi:GntR family transcriptional regulator
MDDFAEGSASLVRDSPLPLWAQLEAELRRRLDLGHFEGRFPTDRELVDIYGVSRHTARHAVERLTADGLIKRARGIGTTVERGGFEQSLGALYSLFRSIESQGVEQQSKVLALGVVTDPSAAEHLGLGPDAELVHLSRVRFADGSPLALDRVWLPNDVASSLLEVDFTHTALYDELATNGGLQPNRGWERITPVIPEADERALLEIGERDAAFSLERRSCHDEQPIEWRITIIRGDRFSFIADWSAGQPAAMRLAPHEQEPDA